MYVSYPVDRIMIEKKNLPQHLNMGTQAYQNIRKA